MKMNSNYIDLLREFGITDLPETIPETVYQHINPFKDDEKPTYQMGYVNMSHCQIIRKHIYDRPYHFRVSIQHLFGYLGPVPSRHLLEYMYDELGQKISINPKNSYIILRSFLCKNKLPQYYRSIPMIIPMLGGPKWPEIDNEMYTKLQHLFRPLHLAFRMDPPQGRQRFPKMIYIAIRLLETQGIKPPYYIPCIKTRARSVLLEPVWNQLVCSKV